MLEIILAWTMSCTQYDEAIKNLYRDEYFARPENLQHRSSLHKFFKSRTNPQCVTELAELNDLDL